MRIPAVSLLTAWATNVQVELFLALDWQMEPRDKLVSSAHPLDWWRLVGAATFPLLGCVVKRLFGVLNFFLRAPTQNAWRPLPAAPSTRSVLLSPPKRPQS